MQSYGIFLNSNLLNILIFNYLITKLLNFSELQQSLAVHNWKLPANRHKKLHKQCLWSDKYKMKMEFICFSVPPASYFEVPSVCLS